MLWISCYRFVDGIHTMLLDKEINFDVISVSMSESLRNFKLNFNKSDP